eukprot:1965710-Prymnesium_polylepis.1
MCLVVVDWVVESRAYRRARAVPNRRRDKAARPAPRARDDVWGAPARRPGGVCAAAPPTLPYR